MSTEPSEPSKPSEPLFTIFARRGGYESYPILKCDVCGSATTFEGAGSLDGVAFTFDAASRSMKLTCRKCGAAETIPGTLREICKARCGLAGRVIHPQDPNDCFLD